MARMQFNSGQIQTIVCPPGNPKASFSTAAAACSEGVAGTLHLSRILDTVVKFPIDQGLSLILSRSCLVGSRSGQGILAERP